MPTSPPVLATRSINGLLGGGSGVDSGHQALEDAVVVVDHLFQVTMTLRNQEEGQVSFTLASGARQLVVQDALETIFMSLL